MAPAGPAPVAAPARSVAGSLPAAAGRTHTLTWPRRQAVTTASSRKTRCDSGSACTLRICGMWTYARSETFDSRRADLTASDRRTYHNGLHDWHIVHRRGRDDAPQLDRAAPLAHGLRRRRRPPRPGDRRDAAVPHNGRLAWCVCVPFVQMRVRGATRVTGGGRASTDRAGPVQRIHGKVPERQPGVLGDRAEPVDGIVALPRVKRHVRDLDLCRGKGVA